MVQRRMALGAAVAAAGLLTVSAVGVGADDEDDFADVSAGIGNMIFFHPDGTDAAYWEAGRVYWSGPDENSNWDLMPYSASYRGHMADQLVGTSNGGATVHAFGYKVDGPNSYGRDTGAEDVLAGDADEPRDILSLSGYPGSWLREAGNAGHPIGIVNDGDIAEPGTGAFLAETASRGEANEIVRQIFQGRPGFEDVDHDPVVVLGGGEENFFPEGTPYCAPEALASDCLYHRPAGATLGDEIPDTGGVREDGLNLVAEAEAEGYTVIRTRAEFDALVAAIEAGEVDPAELKVLGIFADEDIFNDDPEEALIAAGLVDPAVDVDARETNIILYGAEPGTPGYLPPTAPELNALAITVLDAHAEATGLGFGLVSEVESTDNFGNDNNGIGALRAIQWADQSVGVFRSYLAEEPNTTLLIAADSSGSAPSLVGANLDGEIPEVVTSVDVNPTGLEESSEDEPQNPLDGRYGRETAPFVAAPDQFGQEFPFGIAWSGGPDFYGGIVSRAEGLNAELLGEVFSDRFDSIDVYRMAYLTMFGEALEFPTGEVAPTRPAE